MKRLFFILSMLLILALPARATSSITAGMSYSAVQGVLNSATCGQTLTVDYRNGGSQALYGLNSGSGTGFSLPAVAGCVGGIGTIQVTGGAASGTTVVQAGAGFTSAPTIFVWGNDDFSSSSTCVPAVITANIVGTSISSFNIVSAGSHCLYMGMTITGGGNEIVLETSASLSNLPASGRRIDFTNYTTYQPYMPAFTVDNTSGGAIITWPTNGTPWHLIGIEAYPTLGNAPPLYEGGGFHIGNNAVVEHCFVHGQYYPIETTENPYGARTTATITNTVLSGDYATYTATNSFAPGYFVSVTGSTNGSGVFNVTNAVIYSANSSSFTVALNSTNVTSAADTGTASELTGYWDNLGTALNAIGSNVTIIGNMFVSYGSSTSVVENSVFAGVWGAGNNWQNITNNYWAQWYDTWFFGGGYNPPVNPGFITSGSSPNLGTGTSTGTISVTCTSPCTISNLAVGMGASIAMPWDSPRVSATLTRNSSGVVTGTCSSACGLQNTYSVSINGMADNSFNTDPNDGNDDMLCGNFEGCTVTTSGPSSTTFTVQSINHSTGSTSGGTIGPNYCETPSNESHPCWVAGIVSAISGSSSPYTITIGQVKGFWWPEASTTYMATIANSNSLPVTDGTAQVGWAGQTTGGLYMAQNEVVQPTIFNRYQSEQATYSTTSSTPVSAGTSTIAVGSTTGINTSEYLYISSGVVGSPSLPSPSDFEAISYSHFSVVDGTHLSITFTIAHSGTYMVSQGGENCKGFWEAKDIQFVRMTGNVFAGWPCPTAVNVTSQYGEAPWTASRYFEDDHNWQQRFDYAIMGVGGSEEWISNSFSDYIDYNYNLQEIADSACTTQGGCSELEFTQATAGTFHFRWWHNTTLFGFNHYQGGCNTGPYYPSNANGDCGSQGMEYWIQFTAYTPQPIPTTNALWRDNLFAPGAYLWQCVDASTDIGNPTSMASCWSPYTEDHNMIVSNVWPLGYPISDFWSAASDLPTKSWQNESPSTGGGSTNSTRIAYNNNHDFRLCTGVGAPVSTCPGASAGHNAASDGTDIGFSNAALTSALGPDNPTPLGTTGGTVVPTIATGKIPMLEVLRQYQEEDRRLLYGNTSFR